MLNVPKLASGNLMFQMIEKIFVPRANCFVEINKIM